jgi:hypothetical protein
MHAMVTVHAKVDKIEAKRVALRTRSGLIWLPRDKVVCSKHSQTGDADRARGHLVKGWHGPAAKGVARQHLTTMI